MSILLIYAVLIFLPYMFSSHSQRHIICSLHYISNIFFFKSQSFKHQLEAYSSTHFSKINRHETASKPTTTNDVNSRKERWVKLEKWDQFLQRKIWVKIAKLIWPKPTLRDLFQVEIIKILLFLASKKLELISAVTWVPFSYNVLFYWRWSRGYLEDMCD
jgi:hypothetical protein